MAQKDLPAERLENRLADYKPALNSQEAVTEADRCLNCYDAPCISACPTRINIPQFISRIASQNILGAAKTILEANILGESCANACPTEVLCEGACVYHRLNKKPIGIGRLQQFAVSTAAQARASFFEAGPATGKKVALVGAGPASIACAHQLRILGHQTVIFERGEMPGGLNTSGIAPYKMKAGVSLQEIERISAIGIEYQYGQTLGQNLDLEDLLQRYDAVFLGMGLGPDQRLDIPGAQEPAIRNRILGAVEFITELKTARSSDMPQRLGLDSKWLSQTQHALIIGGGNTALDVCRELKQLGIPQVLMCYRRGEVEMSGYAHELSHAREEGVTTLFYFTPIRIKSSHDRISVEFKKNSALGNSSNTIDESFEIQTDLIVFATGQAKLEKLLSETRGLVFDQGRLKVDPQSGQTGHPRIFAGGDLANGGMEVVNAVAEGKKAALGIQKLFSQLRTLPLEESRHV